MTHDPAARRAQLRSVVDAYFTALSTNQYDAVPWDEAVVLRSPLAPPNGEVPYERYPLNGRAAVREWFGNLGPNLGKASLVDWFVNEDLSAVCAEAEVTVLQPPCTLRVIDKFVVNGEGRITDQENHYDPRPALQVAPM